MRPDTARLRPLRYHRPGTPSAMWHLLRDSGGFRTVQLNLAGWLAVLAPGAIVGAIVGRLAGRSAAAGIVVGSGTAWLVAVGVDSHRWRDSDVGFQLPEGLSPPERDAIRARLAAFGVQTTLVADPDPDTGKPRWMLVTRMRHRRQIEVELGW